MGLAAVAVLGACTDTGNSDEFCTKVRQTPSLAEVLAGLETGDAAGSQRRLEDAIAGFQSLERAAPGEIRADVARLRGGVELVLQAVQANPDDLPAAREAIARQADELSGLARAGDRVVSYADTECGVSLDDPGGDLSSEPDTTEGSEPDTTEGGG